MSTTTGEHQLEVVRPSSEVLVKLLQVVARSMYRSASGWTSRAGSFQMSTAATCSCGDPDCDVGRAHASGLSNGLILGAMPAYAFGFEMGMRAKATAPQTEPPPAIPIRLELPPELARLIKGGALSVNIKSLPERNGVDVIRDEAGRVTGVRPRQAATKG